MKSSRNILLHRMTLAIVLALLVFIQVIKSVHHHSPSTEKFDGVNHLIKQASNCPVCDYHFDKEAERALASGTPLMPVRYKPADFVTFSITTSIGQTSADRGPPSIA